MKKFFLAIFTVSAVACLLQNCKKVSSKATVSADPNALSTLNKQRTPSTEELQTLSGFLRSNYWNQFATSNASLVSNTDSKNAIIVTSYSKALKTNLSLMYLPVASSSNDSYIAIVAKEDDYKNNNFDAFRILFQKNISVTHFLQDKKYFTEDIEIYGINLNLHVHEFQSGDTIACQSTWSQSYKYLNPPAIVANLATPTGTCVSASYDNQVADCTGWCHIAFELDFSGVMHAAYATTAVLWCTTHNNNPWLAP
jgi:hypothetical protein